MDKLAELVERENRLAKSDELTSALGGAINDGKPKADDAPVYDRESEHSPLADLLMREAGDPEAAARINKANVSIKERATTSADLGGLVVPHYAVEDYANIVRELRPFADSLNSRPLRSMTTIISRQTDGTDMDTSGDNGSETGQYVSNDIETEPITVTARRIAGVAEVSQIGLDFSAIDDATVWEDMFSAYATRLDYRLWHGTGLNGQHLGVFNTPGLEGLDGTAVATFAAYWSAVGQAKGLVHRHTKARATHLAISSARWSLLEGATDASGRPLLGFTDSAPQNVGGNVTVTSAVFNGLRVVVDDNIIEGGNDINDDKLVVYSAPELSLYEANSGVPTTIRVDQAKADQGVVQFVAYGYSAFTAERRPKAVVVIEDLPVPDGPLAPSEPEGS